MGEASDVRDFWNYIYPEAMSVHLLLQFTDRLSAANMAWRKGTLEEVYHEIKVGMNMG